MAGQQKSRKKNLGHDGHDKSCDSCQRKMMSYLKAPKTYNILKKTFIRYVKNRLSTEEVIKTKLKRKIVLPSYLEAQLVTYCVKI